MKIMLLKLRGGYVQINRTRQVCPKCGHKTSIFTKSEGKRFCIYPDCNWEALK